jgi:aromatic ring-opening dioxygenase catalytic subunit (LigB family)
MFHDDFYGDCYGFVSDTGWTHNTYDIVAKCNTDPQIIQDFYEVPEYKLRKVK